MELTCNFPEVDRKAVFEGTSCVSEGEGAEKCLEIVHLHQPLYKYL